MADSTPQPPRTPAAATLSPAETSRGLIRSALKAALATHDATTAMPYVSLVTLATLFDGAPVMLISRLARHTQNLIADPRASLLIDATSTIGDPLAGGRVTVMGRAAPTSDPGAGPRFLARHPAAAMYAGFADFAFYRFEPEAAHFIGGFGRIVDIGRDGLLINDAEAAALKAAEPDIIAHMNADHADAVALYATRLGGGAPGRWRMSGCDSEGVDLISDAGASCRVRFVDAIKTAGDARRALAVLADAARALAS